MTAALTEMHIVAGELGRAATSHHFQVLRACKSTVLWCKGLGVRLLTIHCPPTVGHFFVEGSTDV